MKKTNEEISQELVSKFDEMLSHMEACLGVSERERLKDEFLKALEEKDREHQDGMIELKDYIREQMYDIEPEKKERIMARIEKKLNQLSGNPG